MFEKISEAQKAACIELWLSNKFLPSHAASRKRSEQICYLLTEVTSGKVIGVNTLYQGSVSRGGTTVWLNRMFIDPAHRDTRLMIVGTSMMLCFAKTYLESRGLPGVGNVNENRKLSRPGMQRIFQRLGYQKLGWQNGNEVIIFRFSDVQFITG